MKENAVIENLAQSFLDRVFEHLEVNQIDIKNWEIDHLCYRTSSQENYFDIKKRFQALGQLLIESEVNGRPIATYKLERPLFYRNWIIDLVEVPAPKPDKVTQEGFEHIEVVIDESFNEIIKKNPKLSFNKKGLSKELNPELEIEFGDCALKFHHKSLEHIINIEKNPKVCEFLKESKVLSTLKEYTPCLSGTLPLGVHHHESDLDILFSVDNLEFFLEKTQKFWGERKNFSHKFIEYQGLKSLVINFEFNGLPVEFFCQDRNVYHQQANQHFLIEGRLLKILGKEFFKKMENLKSKGVKTEPAFGKLLGLDEPYQELIELNKLNDLELYKKFK